MNIIALYYWNTSLIILNLSQGENSIVIVSGANEYLEDIDIKRAKSAIVTAAVVVCQLEIQPQITQLALALAKNADGKFHLTLFVASVWGFQYLRLQYGEQQLSTTCIDWVKRVLKVIENQLNPWSFV